MMLVVVVVVVVVVGVVVVVVVVVIRGAGFPCLFYSHSGGHEIPCLWN
jgi:hypothetical protein